MSDAEARLGAGNVVIMLGERECKLKPSVHAIRTLSRQAGGIRSAINACMNLEVETIFNVVRVGLGPDAVKELGGSEKIEELIYEEGLTDTTGGIVEACVEYLMNLARGGRPVGTDVRP